MDGSPQWCFQAPVVFLNKLCHIWLIKHRKWQFILKQGFAAEHPLTSWF
jgi:hypothetical protein